MKAFNYLWVKLCIHNVAIWILDCAHPISRLRVRGVCVFPNIRLLLLDEGFFFLISPGSYHIKYDMILPLSYYQSLLIFSTC